jgi:SHS2 domain-containing protein
VTEANIMEGGVEPDDIPVPGVSGLDHTADVGLEVEAPDLPELFRRAAIGALWLVLERQAQGGSENPDEPGGSGPRTVELSDEDLGNLLRSWLRTVLLWAETDEFVTTEARLTLLPTPLCKSPDGLAYGLFAEVEGQTDQGPRVREIKGVTLHGLRVEKAGEGWFAQVIFDV